MQMSGEFIKNNCAKILIFFGTALTLGPGYQDCAWQSGEKASQCQGAER